MNNLSKTLDLVPVVPGSLVGVPPQYQMALLRPRRWDTVTARLLAACESVEFAKEAYFKRPASAALYLSLRFMEVAQLTIGNLSVECVQDPSDPSGQSYRMSACDLESNSQIVQVYRPPALPGAIKRALIGSLVPFEVGAVCLQRCREVVSKADGKDPVAACKPLIALLGEQGVTPAEIKDVLGKSLTAVTARDAETLRSLCFLLRDGEITWADVVTRPAAAAKAEAPDKPKPRAPKKPRAATAAAPGPATAAAPPAPQPTRASLRDEEDEDGDDDSDDNQPNPLDASAGA